MSVDLKSPEFARGEVRAKIQWGADVQEVADILASKYGVTGADAEWIIEEALAARRSLVRKKAGIRLVFAAVGLAVSITYFGIQGFVGFVRVGVGLILMVSLGLVSLAVAAKSTLQVFTGEMSGPV